MNRTFQFILTCFILTMAMTIHAQTDSTYFQETVKPRIRVIIDNDFGGDPDGLFQLVHHILSPSVQIKGIIGSQNYNNGFYGSPGSAVYACTIVIHELLAAMPYAAKNPCLRRWCLRPFEYLNTCHLRCVKSHCSRSHAAGYQNEQLQSRAQRVTVWDDAGENGVADCYPGAVAFFQQCIDLGSQLLNFRKCDICPLAFFHDLPCGGQLKDRIAS